MEKGSSTDFDLSYVYKIAEHYNIKKNDRIKNIYESDFESVPIERNEASQKQIDFEDQDPVMNTVKQYFSNMLYPSNPTKHIKQLPNIELELQFVNGYNSLESTQNLFFVDQQHILFSSAILGIVMNIKTREQQFYGVYGEQTNVTSFDKFHRGSIVCLDYLPSKKLVATGSMCLNPQICIWQSHTLKNISKLLQGKKTKSVGLIKFLMQGKFVISVQRSNKLSVLYIWTIQGQKKQQLKIQGSIYGIATFQNNFLVASSKGTLSYQYLQEENNIVCKKLTQQFCIAVAYFQHQPVFSNCYGNIFYKQKSVKLDEGGIFCIKTHEDMIYASGSESKKLFVLNSSLQIVKQFVLEQYARSIDVLGNMILLGLRSGSIVLIQGQQTKVIMRSHSSGELWGLCYDQIKNQFITAGDDNKILHFDIQTKVVVGKQQISSKQCYNPLYERNQLNYFPCSKQSRQIQIRENVMAYSTNFGELVLLYLQTSKQFTYQLKDKSETLKFSDDGNYLAVGSHDDCIYIFAIDQQKGIELVGTLSGHESYINDLDFSLDAKYLRSAGVEEELRYWNLSTMKQVVLNSKSCSSQQVQEMKDMYWSGLCRFCWQTSRIWKQKYDSQFFNGMQMSKSQDYLALGEDDNCIRVYWVPADKFRKFRGHGNHVINVSWSKDDEYLGSVGGPDRSFMLWKVKQASTQ